MIQNLTLSNKGLKTPAGALAVNILNAHIAIKIEFHIFYSLYFVARGERHCINEYELFDLKKTLRTQMGWKSFKTFSKTEPFHLVVELPDVFPVRGCSYITLYKQQTPPPYVIL